MCNFSIAPMSFSYVRMRTHRNTHVKLREHAQDFTHMLFIKSKQNSQALIHKSSWNVFLGSTRTGPKASKNHPQGLRRRRKSSMYRDRRSCLGLSLRSDHLLRPQACELLFEAFCCGCRVSHEIGVRLDGQGALILDLLHKTLNPQTPIKPQNP